MIAYCRICEKTFNDYLYPEALMHLIENHLELLASFDEYDKIIELVKRFVNLLPLDKK